MVSHESDTKAVMVILAFIIIGVVCFGFLVVQYS